MSYPPRRFEPTEIQFITSRTAGGKLYLRPSPELNNAIGGVLAEAQRRYPVSLYDFVFLSNHMHLALQGSPELIPAFMRYLKANIAAAVNRILNRDGQVWQRRYSASPILDEGGQIDRALYIYSHGVKEGLVARAEQWPGIASLKERLSRSRPSYERLDRAALTRARHNRKNAPSTAEFTNTVQVELTPWPFMRGLTAKAARARLLELVEEAHARAETTRGRARPLGVRAVLAQDPSSRPREALQRRPNPLCHARSEHVRDAYRDKFEAFLQEYVDASKRFRAGDLTAPFPEYSFRPPLPLDWGRASSGAGPPSARSPA